jgi:hypothetical protein
MVVFVAASPSPNAWEVAGAIAFFAGVLALSHPGAGQARRTVGACIVLGGLAIEVSRSLGPVWLVLLAVLGVAVGDPRRLVSRLRRNRVATLATAGVLGAGGASTVLWELLVQPKVRLSAAFAKDQLGPSFGDLDRVAHEIVGRFGAVDVPMPEFVAWTWAALVGVLVVAALVSARGRRAAVALLIVSSAAVVVLVAVGVMRQNGFGLQGRHVLAGLVALPMGAAWALARRAPNRGVELIAALSVAWVVVANAVGWWSNATTYMLGPAGLRVARWHTSYDGLWGGADLWRVVVALGALAGLAAAVVLAADAVRTRAAPAVPPS